jgi:DNA-binding transcriptional MerR regulator/methylmalonyl-CoA mutase cobalamin-binding subunit
MSSEEESYSIRVVSRLSGISADTLRMWERRYGFPNPTRLPNGNRVYSSETVQRLVLVARALDAGFRPREVVGQELAALEKMLLRSAQQAAPAPGTGGEPWRPVMEAICKSDVNALRSRLRQLVATLGAKRFVVDVVSPLLVEVGRAWAAGSIDVRHEHLASEALTTQIRLLLASFEDTAGGKPTVVLATLPQEQHRLGMEMAALYLAAEGTSIRLLGADTPADQLVEAAKQLRANVVALSVSASSDPIAAGGYLRWIMGELPESVRVWLGGANAPRVREEHERIRVVQTWDEVDVELARARASVVGAA